ncbi:MAG: bactofilin family protein [Pseudomonadota bacterium]
MWGNSKKFKSARLDTMVGPNTEIKGDIEFEGCLHIDGVVNGNVVARESEHSMLTLNGGGRVTGEIHVPNMLINGVVEGDVYASTRVELSTNAEIKGNVYYHLLEMAMGASINGNLVHRPQSEMRLLEHQGDDDKQSAETVSESNAPEPSADSQQDKEQA